jgi:hypothetical protein
LGGVAPGWYSRGSINDPAAVTCALLPSTKHVIPCIPASPSAEAGNRVLAPDDEQPAVLTNVARIRIDIHFEIRRTR